MHKLKTNLSWWSLLVFVLVIPLSFTLSVKILIVTLLSSFIRTPQESTNKHFFNGSWEIAFYLLVLIFGLFYSSDFYSGLKVLETNFSFFAMPIIFSRIRDLDERRMTKIFSFFSIGLFIACIILLGSAFIRYFQNNDIQVFFFYQLTDMIGLQPTYLAYYLIFSISFGLYLLSYERPPVHPWVCLLIILFFFIVLLLTGGQTAFVSLLLVCSFFVLKFFLGDRSGNQKLTIGLVAIMIPMMFFISTSRNGLNGDNLNDSWDRFELWNTAIRANSDIIFGVGTGDSKDVLNEYFKKHNLQEYDNLNSHNQFIQIYLSNGIGGFIAILFILARPLYLSFSSNHPLGVLVFFPFLIYGMTEVFLGRYQGVVFFALLHEIFVSFYQSSKPSYYLKET